MINLIKTENKNPLTNSFSPEDNKEKHNITGGLNFHDIFKKNINDLDSNSILIKGNDLSKLNNENLIGYNSNQNEQAPVNIHLRNQQEEIKDPVIIGRPKDIDSKQKNVDEKKAEQTGTQENSRIDYLKSDKSHNDNTKKSINENDKKISEEDQSKEILKTKTVIKNLLSELEKLIKNKKKLDVKDINLILNSINHHLDQIKGMADKSKTGSGQSKLLSDYNDSFSKFRDGFRKNLLEQGIRNLKAVIENLDLKNSGDRNRALDQLSAFKESLMNIISKHSNKKHEKEGSPGEKINAVKADAGEGKPEGITVKLNDAIRNESFKHFNNSDYNDGNNGLNFNVSRNSNGTNNVHQNQNEKNIQFRQQLQEIIDNSKVTVKDGKNATFSMKLYPKELGSVNINLGLEHGVLNGKFLVENAASRDLLLQNLAFIKEELMEAGIQLGEFNVNINNRGDSEERKEQGQGSGPIADDREIKMAREYTHNLSAFQNHEINLII